MSEIMSWLPVKSVLKFKSVCKLWHSITKDSEFIHTHMMRSTQQYIWDVQDPNSKYAIEAFYQGLVVERLCCNSFSYLRLRNPSTNRLLDLPHTDAYPTLLVMPFYVSRTRMLKIIITCRNSLNDNGSFKIITAGVDEAWRMLDVPFTCKLTLYDCLDLIIYIPYQFSENQLWMFSLFRKEEILKYDVVSKVLTRIDAPDVSGEKLRGLATLIELKGMKPYVSKKKKRTLGCWAICCFMELGVGFLHR